MESTARVALARWTPEYLLHGSHDVGDELYIEAEDTRVRVVGHEDGVAVARRIEDIEA